MVIFVPQGDKDLLDSQGLSNVSELDGGKMSALSRRNLPLRLCSIGRVEV